MARQFPSPVEAAALAKDLADIAYRKTIIQAFIEAAGAGDLAMPSVVQPERIAILDKAITEDPDNALAYHAAKGRLFYSAGDVDDAIEAYEAANAAQTISTTIHRELPYTSNLAVLHLSKGEADKAIEYLTKKPDNEDAGAHVLLGHAYVAKGMYTDAKDGAAQALERLEALRSPGLGLLVHNAAILLKARSELGEGDPESAFEEWLDGLSARKAPYSGLKGEFDHIFKSAQASNVRNALPLSNFDTLKRTTYGEYEEPVD